MKVLITGGAGFIGSHLCDLLLQNGHHVTIIDDLSTGKMENIEHIRAFPNFKFAIESIMNEPVMDRLVSECDVIFHLASAVGVDLIVKRPVEVIERCVIGTEVVLKIANRYKKKVLLTSTSEVYGKSDCVPFKEDSDRLLGPTTRSRWSYSCSKAIDEFLALAYHKEKQLPIVIVRLFNTVGPRQTGQYGMVVPRFVSQAIQNQPLTVYGDGTQQRCFGYVCEITRAMVKLIEEPRAVGEIFNLGSTEEVSIQQLAERVIQVTGSKSKIKYVPYEEAYEDGFEDMARRIPDLNKIQKLIGYKHRIKLDEIIQRIYLHTTNQGNNSFDGIAQTFAHTSH